MASALESQEECLFMTWVRSRIDQFWNAFGLLVCLAAATDFAYWRRSRWEMLLGVLLFIVSGNLFARLVNLSGNRT